MKKFAAISTAYVGISLFIGTAFGYEPIPTGMDDDLAGQASVIDGDTIEIAGRRLRLHGVDAPEKGQPCFDENGAQYRCGQLSAMALSDFIGVSTVFCKSQDYDRYGRIVAKCKVRGQDIEAWLVSNGYATAYRKYSTDYVSEEDSARVSRRGIWRGMFEQPSDWRHSHHGGFRQ